MKASRPVFPLLLTLMLALFMASLGLLGAGYSGYLDRVGRDAMLSIGWAGAVFVGLFVTLSVFRETVALAVRICAWLVKRLKPRSTTPRTPDPERRRFLARSVTGGMILASGGMAATAWQNGAVPPRPVEVRLPIPGLPAGLEGFRIVQITDVHADPWTDPAWIASLADIAASLEPDAFVVTGDLVDGPVRKLADRLSPLWSVPAPMGRFFVTGNHEYFPAAGGAQSWIDHLRRCGVTVLMNEHRLLAKGDGALLLCGVPDRWAAYTEPSHASHPDKALYGAPPADVKILLAHQPADVFAAARAGFDAQISGHTHGGQLFPGHLLMAATQPYLHGLHRHKSTQIYVSAGAGCWGPRLRLFAPAEITAVVLTAESGIGRG